MNGQAVSKAFIPLPAGAKAVYTSGPTLSYFRHPDWLGSSRFASTLGRTMYYSGAYAPFGEAYSEAGTADRSFTGQNQDTVSGTTTGLYDFLYREYAQYGRCPVDWAWSSFLHYATGREGIVEIESAWTARRRERLGVTPKAIPRNGGHSKLSEA